jgi:hypothetical protein
MKKSNAAITSALSAAGGDLCKAASALGVGVQWLRQVKARRGL